MSETSELELFTNRVMLITHSTMSYPEQRAQIAALLEAFRARVKIEALDEGLDQLNEETFNKLRLAEGQ